MHTHSRFISPLLLALALFALKTSEALADETGAAATKITYQDHVQPIFREKCSFCHNQDDAQNDLAVDSFSRLMQGGASGAAVVPGDPDSSRLWKLVSHQEAPEMPPEEDKLDGASLEIIKQWIAGGALENANSKADPPKKPMVDPALSMAVNRPTGEAIMP
ncbi:MAG: hypothetical protein KDA63_09890, partial [Planctomycetales bacterium]|nr:hypothetical protein [Planctomycetales bacterium]